VEYTNFQKDVMMYLDYHSHFDYFGVTKERMKDDASAPMALKAT